MNDLGTVISLPFRFGNDQGVVESGGVVQPGTGGSVISTNDYKLIWKDRVFLALLTSLNERVMRPDYGTSILSTLFETETYAKTECKNSISMAFNEVLVSLNLLEVNVLYSDTSGELGIEVEYSLPDGTIDSLSFMTDTFNRYGELIRKGS